MNSKQRLNPQGMSFHCGNENGTVLIVALIFMAILAVVGATAGATGCGILVVEGDLDASGDFSWYGIIIVTGAFRFTGGGNKNITGAVITGSSTDGDLIGGNTSIIYCSTATESQTQNRALPILSWKEVMGG